MLFVLALTIFASRLLGDSVFGQYVYLLAVTTILSELCVLGTTDYASILIAQEAEKTSLIMANTLGMRIPSSILYIAFVFVGDMVQHARHPYCCLPDCA